MRILLVVLALLALFAIPVLSADTETGASLFAANCATCHGPQGQGDGPAGAALDPRPADLTKRPYKYGCCARMIGKTLKSGVHGTAMPSFASLTDDQRAKLAQYVASLQKGGCGDCKQGQAPCPKGQSTGCAENRGACPKKTGACCGRG